MNRERSIIWTIVGLIGIYIMLQLVADVAAAKIVEVWGWTFPAGTLIYAVTFTWRDLIHKRLGREWARAAIVIAAACNLIMVGYFLVAIELTPADFWPNQDAFDAILGITWRIAVASIVAEVISELIDTEVYHALLRMFTGPQQGMRVVVSNAISLPIDSFVFAVLAFYGTIPVTGIWDIVKGQLIFKGLITVVSIPAIYVVREKPLAPSGAITFG